MNKFFRTSVMGFCTIIISHNNFSLYSYNQVVYYTNFKVLVQDVFGEPAREREVDKISTKLPEARSTKSFESFELVAKKISATQLMAVITPLKEVNCTGKMTLIRR